jgi:hypothetical protein
MSIPAVLWARELIKDRKPLASADRWCLFGFVGLYLWTFVNPALAGRIRVDASVLFIAVISASLIRRALQREAAIEQQDESQPTVDAFAIREAA